MVKTFRSWTSLTQFCETITFKTNIRNVLFQHHAGDESDRVARNLETLSHQLDDRGNLDDWERQGSAENSAPLGNLGSFVPLVLTSLVVATISGTAAYTSLMANPPGQQQT